MRGSARRRSLLRYLPPALLTAGNAAAGGVAAVLLASCLANPGTTVGQWIDEVFLLLGLAMICDALDGPASRVLGVASNLGKKGDAAADAISFGAVPALLIMVVVMEGEAVPWVTFLSVSCALGYAAAAWVRLWKFQAEAQTAENREFVGLPTPAATLLVASCVMLLTRSPEPIHAWATGEAATCAVVALASGLLMLGPWKYPHPARWFASRPLPRVAWLVVALVCLAGTALQPVFAIAGVAVLYAVCGPVRWLLQRGMASPLGGMEHGSA